MTVSTPIPFEAKTSQRIPLVSANVQAGFPSPADDHLERSIDLNEHLVKNPVATFFVRVKGDSMRDAGILSGDILIVDRSVQAADNQIVVAMLDDDFTEKSLGWASGKRSYNYQTRIKSWFEPYLLRKLPRFKAIVCHCEKPFRKRLLPPITPEGYYPEWFTSLRPDYALRQWWRGKPKALSHS